MLLVFFCETLLTMFACPQRYLQEHGEVQISALGTAVSPAATVAEILKSKGLAVEKQIATSLEVIGVPPR